MTLAHYVLMNKNTPALSFDYDLDDHKAVRIREVFAPEAAPFGSSIAGATFPRPS